MGFLMLLGNIPNSPTHPNLIAQSTRTNYEGFAFPSQKR
jgi:hypothetical protein